MQRVLISLAIISRASHPLALQMSSTRRDFGDDNDYCSDAFRLLIKEGVITQKAFGGLGPVGSDDEIPDDIRYNNVFQSINVDMVFTAETTYFGNPEINAQAGDLAVLNVNSGSFVTMKVSFVDRATGMLTKVPPFMFMIAGLGAYDDEDGGPKSVTVGGFEEYKLSDDTTVQAVANDTAGTTTFSSDFVGPRDDLKVPHYALAMSSTGLANSVMLKFPRISQFTMTLSVDEGCGDRDFYFGGVSNMVCEARAFCGSMQCPTYYERKNGTEREYCQGLNCTVADDLATCCTPTTPDDCTPSTALMLSPDSQAYANLGGFGPDRGAPPGLRFKNVFKSDTNPVDMVITNTSLYVPTRSNASGMEDFYIMIDVADNTSVDLSVDFYKSGTETPMPIPSALTLGIFDFDMQMDGQAREEVVVGGFQSYALSENSTVRVTEEGAFTTFTATAVGQEADNPTDPFNQTQTQLDKTVSVVFAKGIKHFDMTMRVNGGQVGGRQIMLSGWSTLSCPEVGSYCSTLQCPDGFAPLPNFETIRCPGELCTPADVDTCCSTLEDGFCDNHERLQFTEASLMHNNLGGAGPSMLPKHVRIDDVFPASAKPRTEMRIAVDGPYQMKPAPPENALVGGFFQVQVLSGSSVTLSLKLFDSLTGAPTRRTFALTVGGISKATGDKSIESMSATGFEYYNVTDSTTLSVTNEDGTVTFTSDVYSPDRDLPSSTQLPPAQLDKAVNFKYVRTGEVRLTLSVVGGGGYRTFLIGGHSNLGCPAQPALCNTMICPTNYKLKSAAGSISCLQSTCDAKIDTNTCCEQLTSVECDSNTLIFSSTNLAFSNLGGYGPDQGEPKLLYTNVLPSTGKTVDLEVRNVTMYRPGKSEMNGVIGGFGVISADAGTSTIFEFRLKDRQSGQTLDKISSFMFSLVDIKAEYDEHTGRIVGQTRLEIPEAIDHVVTGRSRLLQSGNTFSSSSWGAEPWTPSQPRGMDVRRLHDSVAIKLKAPVWHVHSRFSPGKALAKRILFAGPTNLACPPRAYCEAVKCPSGLELIKAANETLCMGTVCTAEDVPTCCHYPECNDDRTLVLNKVLVNNLGGYTGSGSLERDSRRIIYGDVFPSSGQNVNLEINVPYESNYFARNPEQNGLSGPFGIVNFQAGSHVDLAFRFRDARTNEPFVTKSFFLTFSGVDMQKRGGRESVTVYGYKWFKVSKPTAIEVETSCDGLNSTFKATESGGTEMVTAAHALAMDKAQKNHTVTLLMDGGTNFRLTMRAESGWSGRNILFAGPSNLVCGAKSSCLAMKCLPGHKLIADAVKVTCASFECLKELDHDVCCTKDDEAPTGDVTGSVATEADA